MQYTPKYRLPIPEPKEDADAPEWGGLLASAITAALDGRVAVPTNGTLPLFYAPGQSPNPVTVWNRGLMVNGSHTGGSNIQFEWTDASVADRATLRAHIDAQAGKPGMQGFIGAGKAFFDLAWLPNLQVSIGVFGGYKDTRYAVVNGSLNGQEHRMIMAWNHTQTNRILVAQEGQHLGQIVIEGTSSPHLKTDVRQARSARGLGDFFDAVDTYTYRYTDDEEAGCYRGTKHVGFMADQVAQAAEDAGLPDGFTIADEDGNAVGLQDRDLLAVLWAVVKEQKAQIADLTARVEALEAKP